MDYDGTLVGFKGLPEFATLHEDQKKILINLMEILLDQFGQEQQFSQIL